MTAYYNEIDPYAAQWLRNLIKAGHIAPGVVDERSIVDVRAADLAGYTQAHFFAGIGGWSLALRLAGVPDDRPVWTGSCPCQPFSAAGAGKAADDERHLWPAWFPLIAECRPPIVFGEQVEAAVGWGWLDAVFADLEGEGYACGASVLPACGVGAPHIRARAWFVAHANGEPVRSGPGSYRSAAIEMRCASNEWQRVWPDYGTSGTACELADANGRDAGAEGLQRSWEHGQQPEGGRTLRNVDHTAIEGLSERPGGALRGRTPRGIAERSGDAHNPWSAIDWLPCTDGKARPVEPDTFPLAHGIPGRVGRLRAYGNAIVPQIAAEFIAAAT